MDPRRNYIANTTPRARMLMLLTECMHLVIRQRITGEIAEVAMYPPAAVLNQKTNHASSNCRLASVKE
jgi:hypothetical protein